MYSLRTLRHLHRRHLTVVRWMTLALLFMLTASTMPHWLPHAHHDDRESAFLLSSDLTGDLHVKAVAEGLPTADSEDAHLHYLAGAAFNLPAGSPSCSTHPCPTASARHGYTGLCRRARRRCPTALPSPDRNVCRPLMAALR